MEAQAPPSTGIVLRRVLASAGLAAVVIVSLTAEVESLVAPVYAAVLAAIVAGLLPLLWSRTSDPFEPLTYTIFYTTYGNLGILAALAVNGEGALPRLPAGAVERSELAVESVALNLLAFTCYTLGYLWQRRKDSFQAPRPQAPAEWSIPRLWIVTAVCMLIFVVTYGIFQASLGLPLFDASTLREGKAVWRDDPGSTLMLRGVQLGFLPLLLWGAYLLRNSSGAAIAGLVAAALLIGFLVMRIGQRSAAVYPLIALLGVYHYLRRRVSWPVIIGGTFALVVFVNLSTRVRTEPGLRFDEAYADSTMSPAATLSEHENERGRLDSTATILFFFPRRVDYLLGESWKPLLVLLVPRWIDPNKTRGHEFSDTAILRTLTGFRAPTPLPALLYANFTYAGVVIGMALYGRFHGRLYHWLRSHPGSLNHVLMYVLLLIFFNPTTAGAAMALQYVVPSYLILTFIRNRAPDFGKPPTGLPIPTRSFARAISVTGRDA